MQAHWMHSVGPLHINCQRSSSSYKLDWNRGSISVMCPASAGACRGTVSTRDVSNTHQSNQFKLKYSSVCHECVQTCWKCKLSLPVCVCVCVACMRACMYCIFGYLPGVVLRMSHPLTWLILTMLYTSQASLISLSEMFVTVLPARL